MGGEGGGLYHGGGGGGGVANREPGFYILGSGKGKGGAACNLINSSIASRGALFHAWRRS